MIKNMTLTLDEQYEAIDTQHENRCLVKRGFYSDLRCIRPDKHNGKHATKSRCGRWYEW